MLKQFRVLLLGVTLGMAFLTNSYVAAAVDLGSSDNIILKSDETGNRLLKKIDKSSQGNSDVVASKDVLTPMEEQLYSLSPKEIVQLMNEDNRSLVWWGDLRLASLMIGDSDWLYKDYSKTSSPHIEVDKTTRLGPFITYEGKNGSYTVYEGDSNYGQRDTTYPFDKGEIINIHVTSPEISTFGDVKVGDARGSIILEYGTPNAIWQNLDTGELIYWYKFDANVTRDHKKGIYVFGDEDNNQPKTTFAVMGFTIKDYKVKAIDIFERTPSLAGRWPAFSFHEYQVNKLENSDFSLLGYRINDDYAPEKGVNRDWNMNGDLWSQHFSGNKNAIIIYDQDNRISSVFLRPGAVTKRGVGIGTNMILMLKVYGEPTKVIKDFAFNMNGKYIAYEYKNPYAVSEYLIFLVDKEDHFVHAVILANKSINRFKLNDDKENIKAKLLIYGNL